MKITPPNAAPELPAPAVPASPRVLGGRLLPEFRTHSFHIPVNRSATRRRFQLLRTIALLALFELLVLRATAGTIVGTVRAEGVKPPGTASNTDDAYDSRKYKFVPKVDYESMRDFVVYIDGLTLTNSAVTNVVKVTTLKVAQSGAKFSPHILPVLAGTTVEWPNNDDIYHNVFSVSDAASFDLGLYKGNPPEKRVQFAQPGKVDVYCSIHANMHCIVLVMKNPYFASTDNVGNYVISNVPPGRYQLKAWHERLPVDTQEITVPETGEVRVDFTLGIKNLPKL